MKLKKVDWKQLMLEKGERIGLVVAGVLAAFMTLPLLYFLAFGPSYKANVASLETPAKDLERKQAGARPGPNDLPPDLKGAAPVVLEVKKIDNPAEYQVAQLFAPVGTVDTSQRRPPVVFQPVEAAIAFFQGSFRSYVIQNPGQENEKFLMLVGAGGEASGANAAPAPKQVAQSYLQPGAQGDRRPARPAFAPPGAGPYAPRYSAPTTAGYGAEAPRKAELKSELVSLQSLLEGGAKGRLAEINRPARAAVIEASFPYRRQIEEHMRKLNLRTPAEVLADVSEETEEKTHQKLPAFRFLNTRVQRRTVDANGQPLPGGDWADLDVVGSYKPFIYLSGKRFEPDPPELKAVSPRGLVMPKLALMQKDGYPKLEKKLPKLEKTLADLAKSGSPSQAAPKSFLSTDGFDVFGGGDAAAPPAPGSDSILPPLPKSPPPVGTRPGEGGAPADAQLPAEYCLVRVIDVDVKPGNYYQYRLQIRMGNPNFGRKDVASPAYAAEKEIASDWYAIPQTVSVPREYFVYAVDQQELEGSRSYQGQNASYQVDKTKQAVFQLHKWVENAAAAPNYLPVGEWIVAERAPVFRGEYVGRTQRVEVPYWRSTLESYAIATESSPSGTRSSRGIRVDFSPPEGEDPVLVDFDGGEKEYARVTGRNGDKVETHKVSDRSSVEALVLSPDGKLLSHDSAADTHDPERKKRLDTYRTRIADVKAGRTEGGTTTGPFGPGK